MKRGYLAGALSLILVLLSGCTTPHPDQDVLQEEQISGISSETLPESGEESVTVSPEEYMRTEMARRKL